MSTEKGQRNMHSKLRPTRGIRKLQQFLGEDEKELIKPKSAKDLVPTLAVEFISSPQGLHSEVLHHMETCLSTGGARKLSGKQLKAVQLLSQRWDENLALLNKQGLSVKRVVMPEVETMWHTIAVAALQRAAASSTAPGMSVNGIITGANKDSSAPDDGRAIFVLTSSASSARELSSWLTSHYHLEVLLAADKEAPPFPVLPSSLQRGAASGKSKSASRGRSMTPSTTTVVDDVASTTFSAAWAVPVIVASPEGFLAMDQRSAVWRCVGVFVLAASSSESLIPASVAPAALSKHRWGCLGHTPLTVVFATTPKAVTSPLLDWLTTVKPITHSPSSALDAESKDRKAPAHRRTVHVHYHALEGMQRIQCFYGLLHGLQRGRGMVVRLATREVCMFLFDVLYRFLDALPPYIRIFSDYDGNSEYSSTQTSQDRVRLVEEFDQIVEDGQSSPVLLTCFGLVPKKGSIFLQYDLMDDLPNFSQFLAEKVTPGAAEGGHSSATPSTGSDGAEKSSRKTSTGEVEVVQRVVSRKRSRSPVVTTRAAAPRSSPGLGTAAPQRGEDTTTCYSFLLILLRPCEVQGALDHLKRTGARHSLVYSPLSKPPPLTRFLFVTEKIRSMHRKLFAIQNAAYHAYKATMTVYCTLGPRDVYNEANLNLLKVAQEFGYEEVPLLDLRLKDTPFRPKEDYVKASRVKMAKERRQQKTFAVDHIHGEGPAALEE